MSEALRYPKITAKLVLAVFASGVMCLCGIIVETALNIAFPRLMAEFEVSTSQIQWLTTGFMVITSCLIPASSYLNQRFSKRALFLMGFFTFVFGVFLDILATSFSVLLLGRIIQGAGMGIGMPLMFNIILSRTPLSHMGVMMGVGTLNVAAAPAIGPVFGGVVMEFLSWRYIFILVLPLLALALAAGLYAIDGKGERWHRPFDGFAFLFISLFFLSLVYGLSRLGVEGLGDIEGLASFAVCFVSGWAFVVRSCRSAHPLIQLNILRVKPFALFVGAVICMQIPQLAYGFLIPNYMQISQGFTAMEAAMVMCPGAILGALLAPVGGRFLDIWGAGRPIALGGTLILTDMTAYALWGTAMPAAVFTAFYVMHMCGIGIFIANTVTQAIRQLPPQESADGNALVNTVQQAACAVGISVGALTVASAQEGYHLGTAAFAEATRIGTEHAFFLTLAFAVGSMICQKAAFAAVKERNIHT